MLRPWHRLAPLFRSGPAFSLHATAPTATYPLSLHDALPICAAGAVVHDLGDELAVLGAHIDGDVLRVRVLARARAARRSEEHTSELQSQSNLVCRLLLEKKKQLLSAHPSRQSLSSSARHTPC